MKRTLTAVEARKKLGEVLEGVYYRGDEVVIERAGKPMGVIIPAHIYANLEREKEEVWKLIQETRERLTDVPEEVLQAEIDEAVREVRREARGGKGKKSA